MFNFAKQHPFFCVCAAAWAITCIYLFALIIFFRVTHADSLYWFDTYPARAIPAWFYIPQHALIYSPLLIAAVLPFVLKLRSLKPRK
ncbi:hypothetical protein [Bradyrhizobium japonicum]|uniref:hypothetical protein n=1 Tax=Bradyrhizobium japonicum TaxID=375 RepID=UPI00048907DB|nr:hypothetical protein [Bradyrhizobium japonicum]WLB87708.1 hypothetical protein QIH91_34095 [Bradyrhizobium japonicum USDA 135]